MARNMENMPCSDNIVHGTIEWYWNRLLTTISYYLKMMLENTATSVMLTSQNLHRDLSNLFFTHCAASKNLMQGTFDEVELSWFGILSSKPL